MKSLRLMILARHATSLSYACGQVDTRTINLDGALPFAVCVSMHKLIDFALLDERIVRIEDMMSNHRQCDLLQVRPLHDKHHGTRGGLHMPYDAEIVKKISDNDEHITMRSASGMFVDIVCKQRCANLMLSM
eukprot:1448901-Pleurochrysis_carterae.AAC.3